MKKAVIKVGGHQYVVAEGDSLDVDLVDQPKKTMSFTPLMIVDGAKSIVGTPEAKGEVKAKLVEESIKQDKVIAIRYKAKKRVHKRRGHRQRLSRIEITSIA